MPNFITSLPARGLLFAPVYSQTRPSPALDQFRAAEGGLHWAPEWLVLQAASRSPVHGRPPPRPHAHLYAASRFRAAAPCRAAAAGVDEAGVEPWDDAPA